MKKLFNVFVNYPLTMSIVLGLMLAVVGVFFSPANAQQQLPIRVAKGPDPVAPQFQQVIEITSMADKLVISDVIANRGNCKVIYRNANQFKLNFGGKAQFIVGNHCNLIEVQTVTNYGTVATTFR